MHREFSARLYIFSFLLTLLIFSLGLTIGLVVEKERLDIFDSMNMKQEADLKSLQLQQNFIESGDTNCDALNKILESNMEEVTKSMTKIIDYTENSIADDDTFSLQLRDYFLTEIQFLTVSKEIQKTCGQDAVTILYFYDDNPRDVQGDVLLYLKKVFGSKLLIFSFDSNFVQEPMIDVLMKSYNVTEFPTVIANGHVFAGTTNAEELQSFICTELNNDHEACT